MESNYILPDTKETVILLNVCSEDQYIIYYYCLYRGEHRVISFPKVKTSWVYSID